METNSMSDPALSAWLARARAPTTATYEGDLDLIGTCRVGVRGSGDKGGGGKSLGTARQEMAPGHDMG